MELKKIMKTDSYISVEYIHVYLFVIHIFEVTTLNWKFYGCFYLIGRNFQWIFEASFNKENTVDDSGKLYYK